MPVACAAAMLTDPSKDLGSLGSTSLGAPARGKYGRGGEEGLRRVCV